MQRATLGVIYTSGKIVIAMQPYCIATAAPEDLPLMINCCNCSSAGRAQRLEWVRRQLDPPATFSSILSQNVQLSTVANDEAFARRVSSDRQALRARPEREVCNPQIHLHLPQHLSHLEARKTDNDNAKQQKRKTEDNSNCSQPLACAQASHPVFKQAGERPALRSPGWNHRCPRSNKRHFPLHNRAAGRGPYISYGRNLQTCLNRPETLPMGAPEVNLPESSSGSGDESVSSAIASDDRPHISLEHCHLLPAVISDCFSDVLHNIFAKERLGDDHCTSSSRARELGYTWIH